MKNWLNNLNRSSVIKRMCAVLFSAVLSAFGISCFYACTLGADPISVFVDGQHVFFGLSLGQITTINNAILVVLMFLLARRYFNIGTIVTCFLTGPLIDLFVGILSRAFPADTTPFLVQVGMLIAGLLLFSFGIAIYITADIGIGAFDFPALALRDALKINLRWVRIALDLIFVGLGYLLGGTVGVGTIAGALLFGPLMTFFIQRIKAPLNSFFGPLHTTDDALKTQNN